MTDVHVLIVAFTLLGMVSGVLMTLGAFLMACAISRRLPQ